MFFISYSSSDGSAYLRRFFKDLDEKVAQLLGLGTTCEAFIDKSGIKTGEDWSKTVGHHIQKVKVLVCIYSPNYFSPKSRHAKSYCAKELFAFVQRHPSFRLEVANGSPLFSNTKNLVPILWYGRPDLNMLGMPPPLLKHVQDDLNKLEDSKLAAEYRKEGLVKFAPFPRKEKYQNLLRVIARQIVEYALSDDAPPPGPDLSDIEHISGSFWYDHGPVLSLREIINSRLAEHLGPQHILVIAIYDDRSTKMDGHLEVILETTVRAKLKITDVTLVQTDPGFREDLIWALTAANDANWPVVIVAAPDTRAQWSASTTKSILDEGNWLVGILSRRDNSSNLQQDVSDAGNEGRICHRDFGTGDANDLRTNFLALVNELTQKILLGGQVFRQSPENDGPVRKPLLTNVVDPAHV